jgi:hypothetical protein
MRLTGTAWSVVWHFSDVADLTDDVGSWGVKRTHSRHRGNDANDPIRTWVLVAVIGFTTNFEVPRVLASSPYRWNLLRRYTSKQLWPRPVMLGSPGYQSRYGDHEGDTGNTDNNLHGDGARKLGQDYEPHKRQ